MHEVKLPTFTAFDLKKINTWRQGLKSSFPNIHISQQTSLDNKIQNLSSFCQQLLNLKYFSTRIVLEGFLRAIQSRSLPDRQGQSSNARVGRGLVCHLGKRMKIQNILVLGSFTWIFLTRRLFAWSKIRGGHSGIVSWKKEQNVKYEVF